MRDICARDFSLSGVTSRVTSAIISEFKIVLFRTATSVEYNNSPTQNYLQKAFLRTFQFELPWNINFLKPWKKWRKNCLIVHKVLTPSVQTCRNSCYKGLFQGLQGTFWDMMHNKFIHSILFPDAKFVKHFLHYVFSGNSLLDVPWVTTARKYLQSRLEDVCGKHLMVPCGAKRQFPSSFLE